MPARLWRICPTTALIPQDSLACFFQTTRLIKELSPAPTTPMFTFASIIFEHYWQI
ncbi:uncharacterized protein PHALS_08973 [Plasmopara halstedii]|uniref:Uncharacterized protein n=1 Tax=Plasmopara halstedii TaxID=4781 RepID=A0A0P1ADG6_PLAHL|nr:uncharacterized protein PHALS_08973 [Plasmopara halstedii]CEG38928.1 hypothetical protein PHALS_08973 [Plasmopara halstedii]|eukprot:XP_024575297.1 hypothetical protein PHALS_08973 [Plasmopara halstedii]